MGQALLMGSAETPTSGVMAVLLGPEGSGKGSLANIMTGTNKFATQESDTAKHTVSLDGVDATVLDTKGDISAADLAAALDELGEANAFVLVLNSEAPAVTRRSVELLETLADHLTACGLQPASVLEQHLVVVVTRWAQDRTSKRWRRKQGKTREAYTAEIARSAARACGAEDPLVLPAFFLDNYPDDEEERELDAARREVQAIREALLALPTTGCRARSVSDDAETKEAMDLDDRMHTVDYAPIAGPVQAAVVPHGIRKTANGICGMLNLGNTCYMNSGIQCLAQAPGLLDDVLEMDLSQLPKHCAARCWQKLLRHLFGVGGQKQSKPKSKPRRLGWTMGGSHSHSHSDSRSRYRPADLKAALGRLCSKFAGYSQQDSLAMMTELLNALDRELYTALHPIPVDPESTYRALLQPRLVQSSDDLEALGENCWNVYKFARDSPVVRRCLLMTCTVSRCSQCQAVAAAFQPTFLLPLCPTRPYATTKVRVEFWPAPPDDGEGPEHAAEQKAAPEQERSYFEWTQHVKAETAVGDVKAVLAQHLANHAGTTVDPGHLVVCRRSSSRSGPRLRVLADSDALPLRTELDLVVYVLPPEPNMRLMAMLTRVVVRRRGRRVGAVSLAVGLPDPLPFDFYKADVKNVALRTLLGDRGVTDEDFKALSRSNVTWLEWQGSQESGVNPLRLFHGVSAKLSVDLDRVHSRALRHLVESRTRFSQRSLPEVGTDCTVDAMLQYSCHPHVIRNGCRRCGVVGEMTRWTSVWRTSDLLLVTVEAVDGLPTAPIGFCADGWDVARSLAAARVTAGFPLPYKFRGSTSYQLFAVSCHHGGYYGGHYTALVKSAVDQQWYSVNDSSSHQTQRPRSGSSARALLYQRA